MIYCIYDQTTGFIYGYFPSIPDPEIANSTYIEIELTQMPPLKEVGKWYVDVNTQQLTKI